MDGRMGGWMGEWTDRLMSGWVGRPMDEWMDG